MQRNRIAAAALIIVTATPITAFGQSHELRYKAKGDTGSAELTIQQGRGHLAWTVGQEKHEVSVTVKSENLFFAGAPNGIMELNADGMGKLTFLYGDAGAPNSVCDGCEPFHIPTIWRSAK